MKRRLLILTLLIPIAFVIWWEERPRPQTIVLTGTVDGNEVVVGSKITGRIVRLAVDDGQRVKAGDLIAVLDQDELRADQGAAGHAIAQARANTQQAAAQTELLESTLPTKVQQASAQVEQTQAQLQQNQAQVAQAASAIPAGAGAGCTNAGGGGQGSGQFQSHPAAGGAGHQPAAGSGLGAIGPGFGQGQRTGGGGGSGGGATARWRRHRPAWRPRSEPWRQRGPHWRMPARRSAR